MALTETQELELQNGLKAANEAIAKLATANDMLTKDSAAKAVELSTLKSSTASLTQESATAALKAKFPDVPTETLLALPEASREAQGKVLQDTMGKFKSANPAFKTGSSAWGDVGGVGPSAEAEDHAQLTAREQARESAVQKGDLMGLLRVKSRDTIDFVSKNFASR